MEDSTGADEFEQIGLSPEDVAEVTFIHIARIYDVLMAQLTHTHPKAAERLLDIHRRGDLVGPSPMLSGLFFSDLMDDEEFYIEKSVNDEDND